MPRPPKPIDDDHAAFAAQRKAAGDTWEQISWDVSELRGARDARDGERQTLMVSRAQIQRAVQAWHKTGLAQNPAAAEARTRHQTIAELAIRSSESQSSATEDVVLTTVDHECRDKSKTMTAMFGPCYRPDCIDRRISGRSTP